MTPTIILLLAVILALIFILCWLLQFSRRVFRINLAERIRVEAELVSLQKQRDGGVALRSAKAQLETQLAECSAAAIGKNHIPFASKEAYAWSPAYQDVVNLRKRFERLKAIAISNGIPRKEIETL